MFPETVVWAISDRLSSLLSREHLAVAKNLVELDVSETLHDYSILTSLVNDWRTPFSALKAASVEIFSFQLKCEAWNRQ